LIFTSFHFFLSSSLFIFFPFFFSFDLLLFYFSQLNH
jgi:hypothetical protein